MFIYHSKLVNGTSFYGIVTGNFSGLERPEIVTSCNSVLQLSTLESNGRLYRLCTEDIQCKIRSLAVVKWKMKDYVAVSSDSGHALILRYCFERNVFEAVFKRVFSIPVTLPEFPGEFVATSWGGVAYGSRVENFYFYGLYTQEHMEKNEPIFMTQPRYLVYDLIGIQCPNDKLPMFISLEAFSEEGVSRDKLKQYLKIYQVDFLTRQVYMEEHPLKHRGNKLIAVPKGEKHPYGVIICYADKISFRPLIGGYDEVSRYLPQRKNDAFNSKKGFIINSSAILEIERNNVILIQTEQGDLFSVTVEVGTKKKIAMKIIYMDTIPVATAMCIRSRHLFIATEFGDNYVYEIKSLGNESEMIPFKSGETLVTFVARKLKNLSILGRLKSVTPIKQCFVSDLAYNDLKKFIFACGRGPSSTLRIQRFGVQVRKVYETALPTLSLNAVWSVTEAVSGGRVITYVLVSLMNGTMVLAFDKAMYIDDNNGFNYVSPTLKCAQCTRDSVIQVYPSGFRHVRNNHYTEIMTNTKRKFDNAQDILRCALHGTQIALALVNKEGLYYEVEVGDRRVRFSAIESKLVFKSTVMCMEFFPSEVKSEYLAVCLPDTLEIYSVNLMEMKCLHTYKLTYKLQRVPESLCISACQKVNEEMNSIIHVGYNDGTLQRIAVTEGGIKSKYSMKLGNKPVKLYFGMMHENFTILAVSNRPWISFYLHQRLHSFAPLDFDQMDEVAFFSARCIPIANMLAISNKSLNIVAVNHWHSMIEDAVVRLTFTPRKLAVNPDNNFLIISESDRRALCHKLDEVTPQKAMDLALGSSKLPLKEEPKVKRLYATCDSLLRIIDPFEGKTICIQPIPLDEAVVSMSLVRFSEGSPLYLLAGIQRGILREGMHPESQVYMYEVCNNGTSFKPASKIVVEDVPRAMCPIASYVLIAIGHLLCLYSLKQGTKLLKRCAVEESLHIIDAIWAGGNCFIVKTFDDRITYGYLEVAQASIVMIHEDRCMRAVTDICFWDNDVIFVASKNSISAVLLPYYEKCCELLPRDPEMIKLIEEAQKLKISDSAPSASQADEVGPSTPWAKPPSPHPGPSTPWARPPSPQPGHSTPWARPPSPQPGPSTPWAKPPSPQPGPSTPWVRPPSPQPEPSTPWTRLPSPQPGPSTPWTRLPSPQPGPSTPWARPPSQVGITSFKIRPSASRTRSSQAEPSISRDGFFQGEPSTSRDGSTQAELSTSGDELSISNILSPSGTSVEDDDYQYPFLRFLNYSYVLAIHKVGEYVNTLQKTSLIKDGREVIVYTTASGIIGVLVPFLTETHHKFFGPLEYLSFKANPILDSEWLEPINLYDEDVYEQCLDDQYVIDAAACDSFLPLQRPLQVEIATKLGASVQEILQKIEEMRRTVYF